LIGEWRLVVSVVGLFPMIVMVVVVVMGHESSHIIIAAAEFTCRV
jgi:hypothetical protein